MGTLALALASKHEHVVVSWAQIAEVSQSQPVMTR